MSTIRHLQGAHDQLDRVGVALAPLGLRLLLAWEYWESGWMKFTGSNWFAEIQGAFPFPFNVVPPEISWFLATWSELLGAIALVVGLATRYVGVALLILTLVAWYSVHAGHGYNVCDNGYKLALMYSVMLLPLILLGAGSLSVDHWLRRRFGG